MINLTHHSTSRRQYIEGIKHSRIMLTDTYTKVIADQVYQLCIDNGVDENSYVTLVNRMISGINTKHKPSKVAILMDVKRRLWHLN